MKHSAISRSCVLSHSAAWLISHPRVPSLSFLNCKCSNVVVWLWLLALPRGRNAFLFQHSWIQPLFICSSEPADGAGRVGVGVGGGVKWALFSVPGVFLVSGKHTCTQIHTCTPTSDLLEGQIRRRRCFPVSFWLHHLVFPAHFQPTKDVFSCPP